MRISSIGIALGAALATLATSLTAAAQDAPPPAAASPPLPPVPPPATPATAAPAPDAHATAPTTAPAAAEKHEEHDPNHRTILFGVDGVIGFRSASTTNEPIDAPLVAVKTVTSLVFGALWHPNKHFAIGARMPLVIASFGPGVDDTSAVAAGNLEIAPEYIVHTSPTTRLALEFGVALPIATGDEFRCDTVDTQQNGPGGFVQTDCAKGVSGAQRKAGALQAASLSRGLEDSALFARHRIGFIPKVSFRSDSNGFDLGASTKLELLQRLNGVLPDSNYDKNATETEWVTSVHGFYHVAPRVFDLGLRAWVVGILEEDIHLVANAPSRPRVQVAVEPAIRLHAEPFHIGAGFILPLGGPAGGKEYNVKAVRLTLGAAFLPNRAVAERATAQHDRPEHRTG